MKAAKIRSLRMHELNIWYQSNNLINLVLSCVQSQNYFKILIFWNFKIKIK